jgi:endoglucanase
MQFTRRTFLAGSSLALAQRLGRAQADPAASTLPEPTAARLPRWRGFNLTEKFAAPADKPAPQFRESDFALMQEWGFNFARLPLSYHCWSKPDPAHWLEFDERQFKDLDQVVAWGAKYGVHLNFNLHRAPGYCVNAPAEPLSLWKDTQALDAASAHWARFARRYQGIPNARLSFDLLNEPPDIPADTYVRVVRALTAAIRAEDPHRLVIVDGLKWGRDPLPQLADLGVAQSTRGYDPFKLTHHRASWAKPKTDAPPPPPPQWPFHEGKIVWDKEQLRRDRIQPWTELAARGIGVHVGEWGAYHYTPHDVVLAWMRDQLDLWKDAGFGWALWNFRGTFGVLNSDRADVKYETFRGMRLDRAMLELLQVG